MQDIKELGSGTAKFERMLAGTEKFTDCWAKALSNKVTPEEVANAVGSTPLVLVSLSD